MRVMSVWRLTIVTSAVWPPASTCVTMYRFSTSLTSRTRHAPVAMYACARAMCSGRTDSSTSSSRSASPPSAPSAAAASMPIMPPEFGTTTPLTFLMMLPLQRISMCSGSCPSTWRAFAAP